MGKTRKRENTGAAVTQGTKAAERPTKRRIELTLTVLLPILSLALLASDHYGLIDHVRGLDKVQAVADNFALSYGSNPSRPIYPTDAAWEPLISLIIHYSKVALRSGREPETVARFQASLSTEDRLSNGELSQWTSPSPYF